MIIYDLCEVAVLKTSFDTPGVNSMSFPILGSSFYVMDVKAK